MWMSALFLFNPAPIPKTFVPVNHLHPFYLCIMDDIFHYRHMRFLLCCTALIRGVHPLRTMNIQYHFYRVCSCSDVSHSVRTRKENNILFSESAASFAQNPSDLTASRSKDVINWNKDLMNFPTSNFMNGNEFRDETSGVFGQVPTGHNATLFANEPWCLMMMMMGFEHWLRWGSSPHTQLHHSCWHFNYTSLAGQI